MRARLEQIKDSLFLIPALYIAAAAFFAWVINRLDHSGTAADSYLLLPTSLNSARSVLSTVAAATITVSALVFSITAVSVQLASQYSPRVLQDFLRDRFQKNVVGFVSATFTFALISLATLNTQARPADAANVANWATTVSLALAVASVLAIVAFIDRTTSRVRVENIIRRISASTSESMRRIFDVDADALAADSWEIPQETESRAVRATGNGWVQFIDPPALLQQLEPGMVARLDVRIGDYVTIDDRLLTVWLPKGDPDGFDGFDLTGITIGPSRSPTYDPSFGLRQLLDIALRALSPGINDPGTAIAVVYHLVEPLRVALTSGARPRVFHEGDRHLATPMAPNREDFVSETLAELRQSLGGQVPVAVAMVDVIGSLKEQLRDAEMDGRTRVLDRELQLLLDEIDTWELLPADYEPIAQALRRKRLEETAQPTTEDSRLKTED